jgi:hypothetical protein
MRHVYCDRDDCQYRSLGGWCRRDHSKWEAETSGSDVDCQSIQAWRHSE